MNCYWLIHADNVNESVIVVFTDFNLEHSPNCEDDIIKVSNIGPWPIVFAMNNDCVEVTFIAQQTIHDFPKHS